MFGSVCVRISGEIFDIFFPGCEFFSDFLFLSLNVLDWDTFPEQPFDEIFWFDDFSGAAGFSWFSFLFVLVVHFESGFVRMGIALKAWTESVTLMLIISAVCIS